MSGDLPHDGTLFARRKGYNFIIGGRVVKIAPFCVSHHNVRFLVRFKSALRPTLGKMAPERRKKGGKRHLVCHKSYDRRKYGAAQSP